jgi:hypothetical protein
MKHNKTNKTKFYLVLFFMLGSLVITALAGCAGSLKNADKPGAMLWGENCGRCHNVRSPETLSDSQWEVAVMHMRTRANLSASEAEKIVEFLKSAN